MTPFMLLPHEDPSDPAHMGRFRNKKHFVWRFLGRQKCYHTQYRYLNSKIFLYKIMTDKHSVEQVEVESLYSIVQISYDQ